MRTPATAKVCCAGSYDYLDTTGASAVDLDGMLRHDRRFVHLSAHCRSRSRHTSAPAAPARCRRWSRWVVGRNIGALPEVREHFHVRRQIVELVARFPDRKRVVEGKSGVVRGWPVL